MAMSYYSAMEWLKSVGGRVEMGQRPDGYQRVTAGWVPGFPDLSGSAIAGDGDEDEWDHAKARAIEQLKALIDATPRQG